MQLSGSLSEFSICLDEFVGGSSGALGGGQAAGQNLLWPIFPHLPHCHTGCIAMLANHRLSGADDGFEAVQIHCADGGG